MRTGNHLGNRQPTTCPLRTDGQASRRLLGTASPLMVFGPGMFEIGAYDPFPVAIALDGERGRRARHEAPIDWRHVTEIIALTCYSCCR